MTELVPPRFILFSLAASLAAVGCAREHSIENHTDAPAGGELVHQPPAPDTDLEPGELTEPDPQADIKKGKPPGYFEVMQVWSDPQGNPDMWKTTGIAIDRGVTEACGIDDEQAYFGFDSAKLKPGAKDTLDQVAQCFEDGKVPQLKIVGHADPRGTDRYNKELGKSRADAVADYLSEQGVPRDNLDVNSKGERKASQSEDEWPQDRRVDILVHGGDPESDDDATR